MIYCGHILEQDVLLNTRTGEITSLMMNDFVRNAEIWLEFFWRLIIIIFCVLGLDQTVIITPLRFIHKLDAVKFCFVRTFRQDFVCYCRFYVLSI